MNLYLRYQVRQRGPWMGVSYRYDGGLAAVAVRMPLLLYV